MLQKEHFDTIENILKMREIENLAMTTITTHKTDMQNLLQKADFIIENIKTVQEKTDHRDDQSVKLREYYLKSQEEDMQSMLKYLRCLRFSQVVNSIIFIRFA